ncbi:MAG: hypothetical protein AAF802_05265 [Planctomycetota bacterium]
MNIQSFLEHHGIIRNPFAEEDAQTDLVFKEHCIANAYHPVWDKVYGDPKDPSTAIVFGPKGSGKTAMRLQVLRHLKRFNQENPTRRVYTVAYDDFNPFLDHFSERMSRRTNRKPERVLQQWKLWDHMDAILCLSVTRLVDQILKPEHVEDGIEDGQLRSLDRTASRDLLLLASCYDQSSDGAFVERWNHLRKKLGFGNTVAHLSCWGAIAWTALVAIGFLYFMVAGTGGAEAAEGESSSSIWDYLWVAPVLMLIGSAPYLIRLCKTYFAALQIRRHMRVGRREVGSMRKVLHSIPTKELASQPLPRYDRTDDRYELLNKFQSVIERLGYAGMIVLMDRVDEPHLTGGKSELMQLFVWPLLDNKLLKHPGVGFKLMLPQELHREMERESRDFHERARLDKQNVIPSFQWTGESLYDLARARMMACAADNRTPEPKDLFDGVEYKRIISAFHSLRVPRHLFRFLYRVLVEHSNRYTDSNPEYKISAETFETALAVYSREVESSLL